MRDGLKALSNSVTATSDALHATWPFFVPPHFETQASDIITQTRIELILMANYVDHQDRETFENFTAANYEEWVREAHMVRYGNLDLLKPFGFFPNISQYDYTKIPPEKERASDREYYLPYVVSSPPPVTYIGMVRSIVQCQCFSKVNLNHNKQNRISTCSPMVELWMCSI